MITKREKVVRVTGDARVLTGQRDAGDLLEQRAQPHRIFGAPRRLLRKTAELDAQQGRLELGEPEVAAQHAMLVPAPAPYTPHMGHRPGRVRELLVVADQDPTLARVQVLAGLKAERADISDGPHSAPLPFGGMGLR